MAEWTHALSQLSQPELEPCLDRAQRCPRSRGDLALAQAFEIRQLDRLALNARERLHLLVEKSAQIALGCLERCSIHARSNRLRFDLILKALLGAAITVAPANAVNRAAARNGDDPSQRLA